MKKIIITTESTSDLSPAHLREYDIRVVPMHVVFEDESLADGFPLEKIHDYYRRTGKVPTTSAVNPSEYTAFFEDIAREAPDAAILHIGYSSACSCSFQNALLGVKDCRNAEVHLVDALNVSGGAANLVLLAANIVREHPDMPIEEVRKRVEQMVPRIVTRFVPENLDYLLAGGRVSNAQAIGARILGIKPRIDIIEGKLIAGRKYRGAMEKVAVKLMSDLLSEESLRKDLVYVLHAKGGKHDVTAMMKQWLREHGFQRVEEIACGCVMSTHGGPGAIGVSAVRA